MYLDAWLMREHLPNGHGRSHAATLFQFGMSQIDAENGKLHWKMSPVPVER